MSRHTRTTCVLGGALAIVLSQPILAGTPYGYGPYDPGGQGGYPEMAPFDRWTGGRIYRPDHPCSANPFGDGSGDRSGSSFGAGAPASPYRMPPPTTAPAVPAYPDYGPGSRPSRGPSSFGDRGFGAPSGFRISRTTSDDAYTLTIGLEGMAPEELQVSTQGQWILLSRERSAQQVQKDDLDDGRGFTRSFSYSTGTSSRRLSVPRDGDLSAMTREDDVGSIRIRIPRRGR